MFSNKKAGISGFLVFIWHESLVGLSQRLDALGAKFLTDHIFALAHCNRLDVRVELPAGSVHRKTTHIAKLRLLATSFTHSHGRCCLDFA